MPLQAAVVAQRIGPAPHARPSRSMVGHHLLHLGEVVGGVGEAGQLPVGHGHDPAVAPDLLAVAVGALAQRDARAPRGGGQQPVDALGHDRARLDAAPPPGGPGTAGSGWATTSAGPSGDGEQVVEAERRASRRCGRGRACRGAPWHGSMRRSSSAGSVLARNGQPPVALDLRADVGRRGRRASRPGRPRTRASGRPAPPCAASRRYTSYSVAAAPGRPSPTSWSRRTDERPRSVLAAACDRGVEQPRLAGHAPGEARRRE